MLLALKELSTEYDVQLYVAHLNHMRGEQAEADANWVKKLSANLEVPFFGETLMCRRLLSNRV